MPPPRRESRWRISRRGVACSFEPCRASGTRMCPAAERGSLEQKARFYARAEPGQNARISVSNSLVQA